MVRRLRFGVVVALLVVAIGLIVSTCTGEPAVGDPCTRASLWHTVTIADGDVLECQPEWGSVDRFEWVLVGRNEPSGDLVWLGWLAAVIGAAVLVAGVVGIGVARYGHRRTVRRRE